MVKKLILVALLTVWTISLIGCQTVAGMGGDIKWSADKTAELLGGE